MSYAASSEAFELIDGHILRASCKNEEGEWCQSEIDLDQHIGNENGHFIWGGENFSQSAVGINLEEGHRLTADLVREDGELNTGEARQGIDLNERIGNHNGVLVYVE
ncbi:Cyanovirin-N [Ascobolus immersus RN42]|uniref:Cyanovirin-N n=1 Tax=Ascobolus immersus RN42 TaxID=1160509 RepID=A0A3N4I8F4_ASCIM|nr:Cyanovirin-N [Ascobolus immersus RN42]